jgi:hypothetical protein
MYINDHRVVNNQKAALLAELVSLAASLCLRPRGCPDVQGIDLRIIGLRNDVARIMEHDHIK